MKELQKRNYLNALKTTVFVFFGLYGLIILDDIISLNYESPVYGRLLEYAWIAGGISFIGYIIQAVIIFFYRRKAKKKSQY
jgi:hypothetical protein